MKNQILSEEFKRMQKLAGILNEVGGDEQSPNIITVKFNGDGFLDQYYSGDFKKIYQADGLQSNLGDLMGEGLEMREGKFYPIFLVYDGENKPGQLSKTNYWWYLKYTSKANTISIIGSHEHYDKSIDIDDYFDSLNMPDRATHCTFDKGITPGAVDDRKYFKIVEVK